MKGEENLEGAHVSFIQSLRLTLQAGANLQGVAGPHGGPCAIHPKFTLCHLFSTSSSSAKEDVEMEITCTSRDLHLNIRLTFSRFLKHSFLLSAYIILPLLTPFPPFLPPTTSFSTGVQLPLPVLAPTSIIHIFSCSLELLATNGDRLKRFPTLITDRFDISIVSPINVSFSRFLSLRQQHLLQFLRFERLGCRSASNHRLLRRFSMSQLPMC